MIFWGIISGTEGWLVGSSRGMAEKESPVSEARGGMDSRNRRIVSLSRLRSLSRRSIAAWNDACCLASDCCIAV